MKKITISIILLIAAMLWSNSIFSQGIAIGEGGSSPHASAILDLQSTQHGLLIPRMTTAQRGEIKSPAEGLLIYNTTSNKLDVYTGAEGWYSLESVSDGAATGSTAPGGGMSVNETGADPNDVAILDVSSTEKGFLLPRTEPTTVSGPTESLIIFNTISKRLTIYDGSDWAEPLHNAESTTTGTGTGSQSGMLISNTDETQPHHSAILELRSTNGKGLLVPRMTTAQRNALAPVQGLIIYNTETQNITYCTGTEWWRVMDCYSPASPTAATHTTGSELIIWNWNTVPDADGYKYNTVNDYATATDNGASTSFTQTGLDCGETHNLFVWSYNSCANSPVLSLNETLVALPNTPTAATHTTGSEQITWNWNTVPGADGYKYNTVNDYATATDNGANTSFTQTGLDCGETHNLFVWSYNSCANSPVLSLNETLVALPNTPTAATHTTGSELITWNWNTVPDADGYKYNTVDNYGTAIDNGTNTSFTQTGLDCGETHNLFVWSYNSCANSPVLSLNETLVALPNTPTAATHTTGSEQIIWNWNTVPDAGGYKYNTVNNYFTAIDNGTSTTLIQDNLVCNTEYVLYIWAYNYCGRSAVLEMSETTKGPCYGIVSPPGYGIVESGCKCWLDRNLGATQVATSSTDAAAYGDLYQWGRGADGHQIRNPLSGTTATNSSTDSPGHSNFITESNSPYDWRVPQNANLWQGVDGTNNPCPAGWRVPTSAEWNTERLSWAPNNSATGAINSPLKLPVAGVRDRSDGSLDAVGSGGYYWSSTVGGPYARRLSFYSSDAYMASSVRAFGFSVRCIKD